MAVTRNPEPIAAPWPLLDRSGALAEALQAIRGAIGGVVWYGEPGGGRTRLAREALAQAGAAGRDTAWVAGCRTVAAVPYGALSVLFAARGAAGPQEFVRHVAAGRQAPLVLVVDDAHLLDQESAALVYQLTVRTLVTPLVTMPSGATACDAVTALWKDGLALRSTLPPLSDEAVEALIGHALGEVDGVTRARIHRLVRGNPQALRELISSAVQEGSLAHREGVWTWVHGRRLGQGLRELVGTRLGRISPAIRRVLEVVACGEPLPVAQLGRLVQAGWLDQAALDLVEGSDLLTFEWRGALRTVRFALPLYAEVIRGELTTFRARELARWLEGTAAGLPDVDGAELLLRATWQVDAQIDMNAPLLLAGAEEAVARGETALAERLLRAALECGADVPARRLLARLLSAQGRHAEAMALLAPGPRRSPGEVDVAVETAEILCWDLGERSRAKALLAETAAAGGPEAARAGVAQARMLLYDGRCTEALDVMRGVQRCAAAPEGAASIAVYADVLAGRPCSALAVYESGGSMLRRPSVRRDPGAGLPDPIDAVRCLALLVSGQIPAARQLADEGYASAVCRGHPAAAAAWSRLRGTIALLQGRLADSDAWLREALATDPGADRPRTHDAVLAALATVAALRGDAAEAAARLARVRRRQGGAGRVFEPWIELSRAWVSYAHDAPGRAVGHARRAAQLARVGGQFAVEAVAWYDVARLGAAATAQPPLRALADRLEGALFPVLADAAEALAAESGARLDAASERFGDLGLPLHAAEAALAAQRAHHSAGRRAGAIAARERAMAFAAHCDPARTPLLCDAAAEDGLTEREREIARLAAAGLPSKAIAGRLTLSVRTVDNHLNRVYAKLGISSRTQLGRLFGISTA
jgi:DNA-binding CsgD family transcriptional regulator